MKDKKLTDKEIVKALECCASGEIEECKNCPYVEGYPYCDGPMERDVLDLINRLQAKLDEAEDTIQFADKELKKAEAENERLKKGWKADVILTANIKAEAYKEFAERLDKEFSGVGTCNYGYVHHKTRKVLKELVGVDK